MRFNSQAYHSLSTDRSEIVPLLLFSFDCVSGVFHVRCLFFNHLFLMSPTFGVSGRLCFVVVAFPGYLYLYLRYVVEPVHYENTPIQIH